MPKPAGNNDDRRGDGLPNYDRPRNEDRPQRERPKIERPQKQNNEGEQQAN
jgi:hypothetical protein